MLNQHAQVRRTDRPGSISCLTGDLVCEYGEQGKAKEADRMAPLSDVTSNRISHA